MLDQRACEYPSDVSDRMDEIMSKVEQMHLPKFQQHLFKYYMEFGGQLVVTYDQNPAWAVFWTRELPSLFMKYEMARNALFALSSLKMWSLYDLSTIQEVYLNYEDGTRVNLYEETMNSFNRLLSSVGNYQVNKETELDSRGAFMLANVSIFAILSVHPKHPLKLLSMGNQKEIDLLSLIQNFKEVLQDIFPQLMQTRFRYTISPPHPVSLEGHELQHVQIPVLQHLKQKIFEAGGSSEYIQLWGYMQNTLKQCIAARYYLPCYFMLPLLAINDYGFFVKDLQEKQYLALKILFYISVMNSVGKFKLMPNSPPGQSSMGIWDQYIVEFTVKYGHLDEYELKVFSEIQKGFVIPVENIDQWLTWDFN